MMAFVCHAGLDSSSCVTAVTSKFVTILNKFPKYRPNLKFRLYTTTDMLTARITPSITKVLDRLFIGGRRDAQALFSANPHQIGTVITLCEQPVGRRDPTIRYFHFPIRDARPFRVSWLNTILIAIEESVARGAVLVHCGVGVSRAPTVVAAYLDRIGYPRFSGALHYLENLRPAIAPSPVLVKTIARELR
jgi:hypothetical protein